MVAMAESRSKHPQEPGKRPPLRSRLWAWTGFADKSLWEWVQLLSSLAIPFVLAIAGFWFTDQQNKSAREIEEQRAQEATLQAYLDQMSTLVLEKNLHNPDPGGVFKIDAHHKVNKAEIIARARTVTVLRRLDPNRKAQVLQFLVEAALVQNLPERGRPVMRLVGADLREAPLSSYDLHVINLDGADLSKADLHNANLRGASLNSIDLSNANLNGADLTWADLTWADLSEADLSGADLSGADLSEADLSGAKGITVEKLEQQAYSLQSATIPNGQKYEDWLLPAGKYGTYKFEPVFYFEVGEDWRFARPETPDQVFIDTGPEGGQLIFTNPRHAYDPSNLSELKELPEPENAAAWVSWFQSHPNLDTSKPVPVSVGGASGKRIDVTYASTPEDYPQDVCSEQPCVPLYTGSTSESTIANYDGSKDWFIIVDVGGETVLIDVAAPADRFDEFLPKAKKVLDSVEWKGG